VDATTLGTISKWAGGELLRGDAAARVTDICTDSRALKPGDLFLALRGENFDGHHFAAKAADQGAAGVLVDQVPDGLPENFAVIKVADTLIALQQIAANYRRSLPLKAVVITGSNGKTSAKDFTAAVLGGRFKVIKTEGNLNNHIGLPLTILNARSDDQIGVFEIGMNHPGEIAPLAKIAKPDVGIITNVGVAHIEYMGSRDAIAQEKGMLAEALEPGGHLLLAADDDYSESISQRTNATTVFVGGERGGIRAEDIVQDFEGTKFTLLGNDGRAVRATLSVPGRHMVQNALLAVTAGIIFGLTLDECAASLTSVKLTKGRLEQKIIRGIHVIDDSYNANPDSMIAALGTLAQMPAGGRRIAVLGRMGELGAESERGHRSVGEAAARERIDCVIGVGGEAALISESALGHGVGEVFQVGSTSEAAVLLRKLAQPGDMVLVKGSRSARMEKILEELAAP
jgi:UDP-N-acetylmuramoyl-tripeptide--D-alanyl-D-alanine ligase